MDFGLSNTIGAAGEMVGGRFKLTKPVGVGGQGEVWEAKDTASKNEFVAVKFFRDDHSSRVLDEIDALSKIESSYVVKFIETNIDEGSAASKPYLVMEYAKNKSLNRYDYFRGDVDLSVNIFKKICLGVKAIHEAGYIHRDLKPSNILVCKDQRDLKVGDFGLTLPPDRNCVDRTSTRENVGPIYFSAPEQTSTPPNASKKSDIYSLGRILHWMITGIYENTPDDPYVTLESILGDANNPEVDRYIERMVSYNPKERPESIDAILDFFDEDSEVEVVEKRSELNADQVLLRNFILSYDGQADLREIVEHMAIIYGAEKRRPQAHFSLADQVESMGKYTWREVSVMTINNLNRMNDIGILEQRGNLYFLTE